MLRLLQRAGVKCINMLRLNFNWVAGVSCYKSRRGKKDEKGKSIELDFAGLFSFPEVEVPHFHEAKAYWEKPMRMLQANCGENSVLGGFHFEFSEGWQTW